MGQGDFVGLLLPSCIDYAVLYAALQRLGAITSGLNPRMGAREVAGRSSERRRCSWSSTPTSPLPAQTDVPQVDARRGGRRLGGRSAAGVAGSGPRDPVAVVWTSGTTGRPKGALFDHANLAAVARGTDVLSQPGDRRLSPLPFAHVAYMTRAWDEIAHGVTTVITPTPWRAEDAIRIMEAERVTVGQGCRRSGRSCWPTKNRPRPTWARCRVVGTGAARMAAAMVADVRERFGAPVVVRYTSTEASLGTGTTLSSTDEEVATTVGRPVPGVELAIVDDAGSPVAPGTIGKVMLRSPAVMRGYWGQGPGRGRSVAELIDAEATASVLAVDGWLSTGDFGFDHAGGQSAAGRPGPRALHPRRLQRVPRRGGGGPGVAPGRGAGRRGRIPRRRAR